MAVLVHIPLVVDWAAFGVDGRYAPPSLAADGYLPLCTRHLAPEIANTVMQGYGDRMLVCIDSRRITSALRYQALEPDGYEWPHLYGPIPLDAVLLVQSYPTGPDGRFPALPETVRALDAGQGRRPDTSAQEVLRVTGALRDADLWFAVAGGWGSTRS